MTEVVPLQSYVHANERCVELLEQVGELRAEIERLKALLSEVRQQRWTTELLQKIDAALARKGE